MRLYLDMDGVLMDYDQHILKWLSPPWTGRVYHHLPVAEWTAEEVANDQRYKAAMADETFWATMPPMADAHLLWNWCWPYNPHILTATPAAATYRDRCANDKLRSVLKHFDPDFPVRNFWAVLRSEKRNHARGGAILVDDMEPNCREWAEAGGTAILHTDAISTIKKLQELIPMYDEQYEQPKFAMRPRNSAERKAEPIHTGCMMYFPDALAAISRVSVAGNKKHNPGEPLHWARGKSMDQSDCVARHSLTPDEIDPESGETELTHEGWRVLAQLQLQQEKLLKEKGVKPYSGVTS